MICFNSFRSAVCTALWLAGIGDASAAPSLTMAHIYDGALDGYGITWTTHSGGYYLFLANDDPNGSIINSAGGLINYELSTGDNRFFFLGDWDRGTPKTPPWGLVLGFNTPSSAFTIFSDHTGIAALTPEASSAYVSQQVAGSRRPRCLVSPPSPNRTRFCQCGQLGSERRRGSGIC